MYLVIMIGKSLDFTPTVLIITPVLTLFYTRRWKIDPVYFGVLFIMFSQLVLVISSWFS